MPQYYSGWRIRVPVQRRTASGRTRQSTRRLRIPPEITTQIMAHRRNYQARARAMAQAAVRRVRPRTGVINPLRPRSYYQAVHRRTYRRNL